MPWLSKRAQISWTESSMPAIGITQWVVSSVGPIDCAKCEPHFAGSMGYIWDRRLRGKHQSETPGRCPVGFILYRLPGGCGSRAGNIS